MYAKDWSQYRIGGLSWSDVDFFERLKAHESTGDASRVDWMSERNLTALFAVVREIEPAMNELHRDSAHGYEKTPTELEFAGRLGMIHAKAMLALARTDAEEGLQDILRNAFRNRLYQEVNDYAERSKENGRAVNIAMMREYVSEASELRAKNGEEAYLGLEALWKSYRPVYERETERLVERQIREGNLNLGSGFGSTRDYIRYILDVSWSRPLMEWSFQLKR